MINRKVSSSPDRKSMHYNLDFLFVSNQYSSNKVKDRPSINNCNSTRKITKNGEENFGLIENWLIALSYFLLIVTMPVSIFVSMKIVKGKFICIFIIFMYLFCLFFNRYFVNLI